MSSVVKCNDDVQVCKADDQIEDIIGAGGDGKDKNDLGDCKVDEEVKSHSFTRKNSNVMGPTKKGVPSQKSLGLIGCLFDVAKVISVGIFSFILNKIGINWALKFFGLALTPVDNSKGEKRKRSLVDTVDDVDEDTKENKEMDSKKWRPDHVYEAINEFVRKMWGEKDSNENIKEDAHVPENDENMNFAAVNHGKWNKKPDINFVPSKSIGIKNVVEAEDSIRDLTAKEKNPTMDGNGIQIVINDQTDSFGENYEENNANIAINGSLGEVTKDLIGRDENHAETSTPLLTGQAPLVFVFSGDKSTGHKEDEDLPEDEQSMLALMTFEEKKIYFAQQIKEQEAAAQKSAVKSPRPAGAKVVPVFKEVEGVE